MQGKGLMSRRRECPCDKFPFARRLPDGLVLEPGELVCVTSQEARELRRAECSTLATSARAHNSRETAAWKDTLQ